MKENKIELPIKALMKDLSLIDPILTSNQQIINVKLESIKDLLSKD